MHIADLHQIKAEQSKQSPCPYPPRRRKRLALLQNHALQKTFGPPFPAPPAQISIYMSDGKFVVGQGASMPPSTYILVHDTHIHTYASPPNPSHRVKNEDTPDPCLEDPAARCNTPNLSLFYFLSPVLYLFIYPFFIYLFIRPCIGKSCSLALFPDFLRGKIGFFGFRGLFVRPCCIGLWADCGLIQRYLDQAGGLYAEL